MRSSAVILLALLAAAPLRSAPDIGLGDGESLLYHVSWAFLPGVGAISVKAKATSDPTGKPLLEVVTRTTTRGLASVLLPFQAEAESLFDRSDRRLVWLGESSTTRGRHRAHTVTFDYAHQSASYQDGIQPGPPRVLPMPPGYPTDLITCLLQAGTWNLRPGNTHEALVLFEDDFYELTIHAVGYDTVTTPLGTFDTVVLEPRMERTPPKGMFKRGSTVRVWISRDARRLPVRFQVEFKVGAGIATLVEYSAPKGSK